MFLDRLNFGRDRSDTISALHEGEIRVHNDYQK